MRRFRHACMCTCYLAYFIPEKRVFDYQLWWIRNPEDKIVLLKETRTIVKCSCYISLTGFKS